MNIQTNATVSKFPSTEVDSILVPHKAFQNAQTRIETILQSVQNYSEPTCIALVGESRTGKSRLLESIANRHSAYRSEGGMIIPVLRIRTPSKPTVKALVESFLRALGDPLCFKRGSENEKTERLYVLLSQTQTHTVIIDEFQHFYDKVSHKVQHYLSDWLKIFVDRSGLTVIVAGLPSSMAVINQNEQLRGRFLAPVYMPRFDWLDDDDRIEFLACLECFQNGLGRFDMPQLDSDTMAFRFYCATGGLIGYVAKILHQACLNATVNGTKQITLDQLAVAYDQAIWKNEMANSPNPFATEFDTEPNQAMIDMARQVGSANSEFDNESGNIRANLSLLQKQPKGKL